MGGMGNNNCNEVRMRSHGAHGAAPAVTMSVQRCSAAVCIPGPHSAETSCTPLQAAQGGILCSISYLNRHIFTITSHSIHSLSKILWQKYANLRYVKSQNKIIENVNIWGQYPPWLQTADSLGRGALQQGAVRPSSEALSPPRRGISRYQDIMSRV